MVLVLILVLAIVPVAALFWLVQRKQEFETPAERAVYEVLHRANAAAPALREGFTPEGGPQAARELRRLLGVPALALCDASGLLAWEGDAPGHAGDVAERSARVLVEGHRLVLNQRDVACDDSGCPVRGGVIVPVLVNGEPVGALAALGATVGAGSIRAAEEVAAWMATQIQLAEFDRAMARAAAAEVKALRAQISPHFIYNALGAIAAFVRTDPERARELLLQFAEFTRYSFRRHGEFTTFAEELGAIGAYLELERARFGERLQVTLRIAPEVLGVAVPFLVLQPLVENAVRHGIEPRPGPGRIVICAEDAGEECRLTVEDDGEGMDPEELARRMSGGGTEDGLGIVNVDERLRSVYGDEYGLVVDTGPGAGTCVSVRIPKFKVGVRAE